MPGRWVLCEQKRAGVLDREQRNNLLRTSEGSRVERKVFGDDSLKDFGDLAAAIGRRSERQQTSSGFGVRQLGKKCFEVFRDHFPFTEKVSDGSVEIVHRTFELSGNPGDERKVFARRSFGSVPAEKFNAPVLSNLSTAPQQNRADLTGTTNVRASARLQINAGDFDSTESPCTFNLFPRSHPRELFSSPIANCDFAVFKDNSVGGAGSAFEDFQGRLRPMQINCADRFTKMKGHRGQAEALLKNGGQQVLASVLLHVIEAAWPANAAIDAAGRNRSIHDVENIVIFEVANIEHIRFAELAKIVGLAAGGGIQMCLVEQDAPACGFMARNNIRQGLAAENPGGEIVRKRIVIIEAARSHVEPSLAHGN